MRVAELLEVLEVLEGLLSSRHVDGRPEELAILAVSLEGLFKIEVVHNSKL